ncbi:acyl-CoA dehydrogenase [Phenylobacterium conjunctum]|uniref:Acyl-CoA dehydrogenase n=1 Tax=Phenylobacterium conjunctum TaxID=1298959 RepID=A0ABW3T374_9CAUL
MTFRAPVHDLALALKVVGHPELLAKAFPDLDDATVDAVLAGAAAFADNELAPLNRQGDLRGATYANGAVTAPPGFAAAYNAFAEQGWNSLAADQAHGGQGLSKALELAVFEMVQAANMAFGLCPMLTQAAIEALHRHGTERQKRLVLPKLVSGEWTGAMCLTEPQAGSDLAALASIARPDGKGGYLLSGQKIFITWGDHDAAENIAHLVIARTPDAPPGVKGISLFLTNKFQVKDDGTLGPRNSFRPVSIEHKLGIHGSPTCVMLYEDAEAELVGELGQGLPHMFVMMNAARLHVGVQGVAIAERAFQQALAFSQERKQGRALWDKEGAIWGHPDVRRTLVLSKAKIEAARAICLLTGVLADQTHDPAAKARQELLTPIAKAWSTDVGVEVASAGLQVHGGMGFIEETGAAQHYRDARILPIYEGTNGIQSLDLVGRKVRLDGGAAMRALCADMQVTIQELNANPELAGVGSRLDAGAAALERATEWLLQVSADASLAAATPYLRLAGDVIGGWLLGRQALAGAGSDDPWLRSKATLAQVYASQVLTLACGLAEGLPEALDHLATVDPAALSR